MCICLPYSNSGPSGGSDMGMRETGRLGVGVGSNVRMRIVCVCVLTLSGGLPRLRQPRGMGIFVWR